MTYSADTFPGGRRHGRGLLAGLVTVALLAAGCSDSPDVAPTEPPPPVFAPEERLTTSDGAVLEFPILELSSAEPISPGVVASIPPGKTELHRIIALGDDAALVTVTPPDSAEGDQLTKGDRVGLRGNDDKLRLLDDVAALRPDDPVAQTFGGALDNQWAVWADTSSMQTGRPDWRLFAQKLDGGSARLLTKVDTGTDLVLPDPFPVISEDRVWWGWSGKDEAGASRPTVFSVPLDGGEQKEMAPLAIAPSPVNGGVVAISVADTTKAPAPDTDGEAPAFPQTGLVRIDSAGKVTELARYDASEDWSVADLASDDDTVAMAIGKGVFVLRADGTPVAAIPLPEGYASGPIAVCGSRVVFTPMSLETGSDKVMVYDAASEKLNSINVDNAQQTVFCSDKRVAWTYSTEGPTHYSIAEW